MAPVDVVGAVDAAGRQGGAGFLGLVSLDRCR